MSFILIPASELPLAEQAVVANRAFANYVAGWHDLDAAGLARFLSLQGADLHYSRFVADDAGRPLGFGYINRAGNYPRLAGMALIPQARGTGAAAFLLEKLCAEAKQRRETAMLLEVIVQNPRAHAFYRRQGFREIGRLSGWRCRENDLAPGSGQSLEEISVNQAIDIPTAESYPAIPWQITAAAISRVVGARAWRLGDVAVVISNPSNPPIRVHSFHSPAADRAAQRAVLQATMARWRGREFWLPAVFPDEMGEQIFAPLGFQREKMSQFYMRRELAHG